MKPQIVVENRIPAIIPPISADTSHFQSIFIDRHCSGFHKYNKRIRAHTHTIRKQSAHLI